MPFASSMRRIFKLSRLLRVAGYRRGLRRGVGAAIEHEGALGTIAIHALIDVGANVGQFSLLAKTMFPGVHIHAFEPLAGMAAKYVDLFGADPTVTLHRVAAGEQRGTADINVSGRPDSSSLLPISARQDEIFPGTAKAGTESIQVERIDDVLAEVELPGPILIKLDVQGFELSALKGMEKTLAQAQYVYCEVSFVELYEGQPLANEIIGWLASRDYKLSGIYNPTFTRHGSAVQADMLFTRT